MSWPGSSRGRTATSCAPARPGVPPAPPEAGAGGPYRAGAGAPRSGALIQRTNRQQSVQTRQLLAGLRGFTYLSDKGTKLYVDNDREYSPGATCRYAVLTDWRINDSG